MAQHIDVFVSSTSQDLTDHRNAVIKAILRLRELRLHPIVMEHFNATDRNALQLCYDMAQKAEIFIGIYAHRYGYTPDADVSYTLADGTVKTGDGETGITHLEYLWAVERKLPMLLFVVDEDYPWSPKHMEEEPGKSRLDAFNSTLSIC